MSDPNWRYPKQVAPRYLESGTYSDLTIRYSGVEKNVHKLVVLSLSDWFQKACEGPFKEGASNVIDLEDDDPTLVTAMIDWMYSGAYPNVGKGYDWPEVAVHHLKVYELANKYQVPFLRDGAAAKFSSTINENSVHGNESQECREILRTLYESISHDGHGLRRKMVRACTYWENTFKMSSIVEAYAKENHEFAVDYLMYIASGQNTNGFHHEELRCSSCDYRMEVVVTPLNVTAEDEEIDITNLDYLFADLCRVCGNEFDV